MTSKLTRDIIQSEIADFFAGVVEIHTELGGPNTVEEAQNQLTDRVLACVPEVDSEPVAWLLSGGGAKNVVCFDSGNAYADPLREVTQLYRHAQHPVVPDKMTAIVKDEAEYVEGWNACRAAMLNGGK